MVCRAQLAMNGCYLPACLPALLDKEATGILVRRESGGLECAAGWMPQILPADERASMAGPPACYPSMLGTGLA